MPTAVLATDASAVRAGTGTVPGYAETLRNLNAGIDGTDGAGRVRVTAASPRSVALTERFESPLVFGYLGFDVPILDGGELGAPIPTNANLTQEITPRESPEILQSLDVCRTAVTRRAYQALQQIHNADARARVQALDGLAALVPTSDTFFVVERGDVLSENPWKPDPETNGYLRFHDRRCRMEASHRTLERLLAGDKLSYKAGAGMPTTVTRGTYDWTRLEQARDEYGRRLGEPALVAATQDAGRSAWRTFYRLCAEDEY
jgi:hypothetical protein